MYGNGIRSRYRRPELPGRDVYLYNDRLQVAFLLTTAWAWNVLCAPDLFFYSFAAMIINMAQTIYLLFTLR